MKAAVYYGPEAIRVGDVPDPTIDAGHQMLVAVKATSICGSDLHIYRGALDAIMNPGHSRTGHELCAEVLETGSDVTAFRPGDCVTIGYSCSCGDCYMCRAGETAHCETTGKAVYGFGDAFGDLNGTHAELMLLSYAQGHTLRLPAGLPEEAAVILSCNLPTALIANRLVDVQPGESVALIGCGPTGLMALDIVRHRGPGQLVALDPIPFRRQQAASRGALALDANAPDLIEQAMTLTSGRGFDKTIEMVGSRESFQTALSITRAGGTVSVNGVFCDEQFDLNLAQVTLQDLQLRINGFASVQPYMHDALRLIETGLIDPRSYFSHSFSLEQIDQAFSTFHHKREDALKVLIRP